MAEPTTNDVAKADESVSVNRHCAEGLHLWCSTTAGRFGRRTCGCPCHVSGFASDPRRVA